jgi:indolepyruvate ferredoxin oxidoreductase alpha subunit
VPNRLLTARAGERLCILGNEAIARGALEAGVRFVSGYPGTPASEIGDTFSVIHREAGIHFEWSVNEKVALEAAFGAAIVGARSLCHMKHLGLAYAGDPLGTIPYVGVLAGMVIVSAGDPGMVVSPNEQDQRHLGKMHMIPVLEPSTPAEACEMTRFAFTLSEETSLPVILRTTPRVAHTRGVVEAREVAGPGDPPAFRRRPAALTPIPANARRMRVALDERISKCEALLAGSPYFARIGSGRLGVISGGASLPLVLDQAEELGLSDRLTVQTLGAAWPLPRSVIEGFLRRVERVLVVEELTPFIEDEVRSLAYEVRPEVEVLGKRTGHMPARFAYTPEIVADGLSRLAGTPRVRPDTVDAQEIPPRPPVLCPGCPHRGAYLAVRTVFGEDGIYFNDIGCYTLGYGPPLETVDALLSMGSSIAMASAASRVLGRKTLAFIGDSTFYHSGMPALLNAAEAGDDVLVVVLDNRVTGMTGHQPSPSTPRPGGERPGERPSPEAVARAFGIRSVRTVDPNDLKATVTACFEAKRERGTSVIVARRDCAMVESREEGAAPVRRRYAVDHERCRHCGHEHEGLFCGQGPVKEYERALVLRRVLDQDPDRPPTPASVELEAPCAVACPANICVQGYVGRIAGGRYAEALALIRKRNPLPVVSSRVCHRPCERVCVRRDSDGAIAVNDLKRWLADWEMAGGTGGDRILVGEPTGRRVAVVGAGPSGLACAHELRVRGHEVVLMDEHDVPGGLLVQGIPEHRLPREVLAYETDWILAHGIEFRGGVRLGGEVTVTGLLRDGFDAVYLGVGAMAGRPLEAPGEELPGNAQAVDLLRRHHRGEPIEARGRHVLVVGGGDAALDSARTLLRLGAADVRIVYRRSREEMPAHPEEVDAAEEEGIELLTRMAPLRVLGTERVEGLVVIRTEPGPPDASGRRSPVAVPGSEIEVPGDLLVAAVGQRPDLSFLDVDLDRTTEGSLLADAETGATSMAGVFAGGDLTPGPKTVIHAIADGRRAAFGIDLGLAEEGAAVVPVESVSPEGLSFFTPRNLLEEPRQRAALRPAEERRRDHEDVVVPLTEQEAREEAARCLLCSMCRSCAACTDLFGCPAFREEEGRIVIDEALCNGCGVCVALCPNGAIHEVGDPAGEEDRSPSGPGAGGK